MKLLYDLFPIILFFVTYHKADTLVQSTPLGNLVNTSQPDVIVATILATGIAIVASFIQVGGFWLKHRRFEKMHLFSLAIISILGGITILFGNPAFIQWKPTVLNWAFAVVFLGSQYIGSKNIMHRMIGGQIELPEHVWIRLNWSWVIFFILSGIANLYVAFYYGLELDEKTRMDNWVNFKLFGLMGMTFVFVIGQAFYMAKFIKETTEENQ